VADADGGATKTNPLLADTDGGGAKDGDEDVNHNGAVDDGERDPNDPADDDSMVGGEGGAGGAAEGGATGTAGNGGSAGSGAVAGNGGVAGTAGSSGSAGTTAGTDNDPSDDGYLEGGGCDCRTTAPTSSHAPISALVTVLGLVGALVRRRRTRP
jgi:MYXO-CTERM domain-containing protein